MAPRSSPPKHGVLVNRTNFFTFKESEKASSSQENTKKALKRSPSRVDGRAQKRTKFLESGDEDGVSDHSDSCYESDSDLVVDDDAIVKARQRRNTSFFIMNAPAIGMSCNFRSSVTTQPILKSFVSSQKSDVYRCLSTSADTHMTLPYACSYSNGSKRGEKSLLAVATEEGSIHIVNTARRKDWEGEQPSFVFQPHDNGVFDVKWNPSDNLLATCCGDKTTRISCPVTGSLLYHLRGHNGTVKCAAWDPTHNNLLSTGARDGSICLWDLRVTKRRTSEDDGTIHPTSPIMKIQNAHGQDTTTRGQRSKYGPSAKSVTNLLYPDCQPYRLISSGSSDGLLRCWDIRFPEPNKKASKSSKAKQINPILISPFDPTSAHNSKRPRGVTSLALGTGRTAGLIFALSVEARVHIYSVPGLVPQKSEYTHAGMKTDSFDVKIATSPCGNWLASGSRGTGSVFLFDISNSARASWMRSPYDSEGVELRSQSGLGEVGAVDWANGCLASCSDDNIVRIWRPDVDVYGECLESPEENMWNWLWSR